MASNTVPPKYEEQAFSCPHCNVYSKQDWFYEPQIPVELSELQKPRFAGATISMCEMCGQIAIWERQIVGHDDSGQYSHPIWDGRLVYPNESSAPPPHEDMPEEIIGEYKEARAIVGDSPRAAAAMLRLCLQKLMPILGEKSGHLHTDIKSLVDKGLPQEVHQALDSVRIFGNESLHPGTINLNEEPATALVLFKAINMIIERMITDKRELADLHSLTPPSKRIFASKHDAN